MLKGISSGHNLGPELKPELGLLLDLDGSILEMGDGYWAKIDVVRVPPDVGRPGGIA